MYFSLAKAKSVAPALSGSQAKIKDTGPGFKSHPQSETQVSIILAPQLVMITRISKIRKSK